MTDRWEQILGFSLGLWFEKRWHFRLAGEHTGIGTFSELSIPLVPLCLAKEEEKLRASLGSACLISASLFIEAVGKDTDLQMKKMRRLCPRETRVCLGLGREIRHSLCSLPFCGGQGKLIRS